MTSEQPHPYSPKQSSDADEDRTSRCMQYLLGELPATELAEFEQQLAVSPLLRKELAAQSELFCMISASEPFHATASASVTSTDDHKWRLVALISALAASFAIGLIGLHWQRDHEVASVQNPADAALDRPSEEALMIARVWAADQVSLGMPDTELSPAGDFEFNVLETGGDHISEETGQQEDSVLSWMVVAVANSDNLQDSSEGGSSDG